MPDGSPRAEVYLEEKMQLPCPCDGQFYRCNGPGKAHAAPGSNPSLPDIPCTTPWQERPPAETEGGRMAMEKSIYQEIAARTGGDIYVGIVGPVRTGKSTFIPPTGPYRRPPETFTVSTAIFYRAADSRPI